ncbi:hypothetical protein KCP78_07345 [Salmonella enterica subsp. enterica]|nr:hypothetical protein KCP78_07345 [Salmonella enterica subsp. enterica]
MYREGEDEYRRQRAGQKVKPRFKIAGKLTADRAILRAAGVAMGGKTVARRPLKCCWRLRRSQ